MTLIQRYEANMSKLAASMFHGEDETRVHDWGTPKARRRKFVYPGRIPSPARDDDEGQSHVTSVRFMSTPTPRVEEILRGRDPRQRET